MRARLWLPAALGMAALTVAPGLAAGATASAGASGLTGTQAYFVQLAGQPSALGGDKTALKAKHAAFFQDASSAGMSVAQRQSFDTLWNGVSVSTSAADAGKLAALPGVQAVYPVQDVRLQSIPTDSSPDGELPVAGGNSEIDLAHSTTMIGSNIANAAGWTGRGVKVAVIDSGVDYTNPDLGGCFGGVCKVIGGWDFVGDLYDSNSQDSTFNPVPQPDANPAPCDPAFADSRAQQPGGGPSDAGHGTHVTGIIAAKAADANGVTGVAPDASILAYRVFGCNGSTGDDIILAALERAYNDGARVVNMSLGDAFNNFADSPDAAASSVLVSKGVNVVAAAGNSGANGLFSTGAPSVGHGVISVASVQNLSFPAPTFDVTNGSSTLHVTYLRLDSTTVAPTSGSPGDIVYVGRGCVAATTGTVDDSYLADPSGKVALIVRGLCSFNEKYARAVAAGAKAVIIMNDGADPTRVGNFNGGFTTDLGVPGVTISFTDGVAIRAMTGARAMTWTANILQAPDPLAGQISSFSSWGLASDLALKPNVTGPGGNIRSDWPMSQFGGHNVISGTSMASPHVAGAVADYLQAHPTASPAQVQTALQNTATPFNGIGSTRLDSVARQGAGLIKIASAINSTVAVSPSEISLGEGHGGTAVLTLTNNGSTAVRYALSNTRALAENPQTGGHYPYTFGSFSFGNNVSFAVNGAPATSVTVPAGGSVQVTATMEEPGWDETALWGGWLNFAPTAGSTQLLRVPFAGFVGDYQTAITPIADGGCNLPTLARIGSGSDKITCADPNPAIPGFVAQPTGGSWSQPKHDPVVLIWHLDFQVQNLKLTLVDAATGQPVTEGNRNPVLLDVDRLARGATPTAINGFIWDGTSAFADNGNGKTHFKAVPAGDYKLVLTATKVKSFNDTRAAQTQTWTSPVISLR